jgi:hypothetical protein
VASVLASPETLGGSTCVFQIGVPDVDAAYADAVKHGAVPTLPPTDLFWGDRYAWIRDPFGHMWALCTTQEILERTKAIIAGAAATSISAQSPAFWSLTALRGGGINTAEGKTARVPNHSRSETSLDELVWPNNSVKSRWRLEARSMPVNPLSVSRDRAA